jgi:LmbE family N-acetylglucosaminyl deacetylase
VEYRKVGGDVSVSPTGPSGQVTPDEPAEVVDRALVIVAHPDDADFGAAGTIATFTAAGTSVTYAIVTNGEAGGFDPDVPRSDIPRIRQEEQLAAAAEVGVKDVRFLGYMDGQLTVTYELRRDLSRVIRQVQPQRVLISSPERNWERLPGSHPDHLAAGEAALQAIYPDARNPFAHPELLADEGLEAWTVPEVWVMSGPKPNRYVDITDTFDAKLAALRAHVSQTAHHPDLPGMLRMWGGRVAQMGGLPDGRLAEAFMAIQIP